MVTVPVHEPRDHSVARPEEAPDAGAVGIGFIGGGAILKSSEQIRGTSTAAAIWATGAIGAAVALDRHELAIAIAVMTFLVFLVLTPVRAQINDEDEK